MIDEIISVGTKIGLSVLLSGILGFEREVRDKVAGLRTHILVGVGSTLVVLTSFYIFDQYNSITPVDPSRMITGIVQGIGFLCAGTIIRGGSSVRGLTSAAALWIVSCIGIAVGAGQFIAAIMVTFTVLLVLVGTRKLDLKHLGRNNKDEAL